MTCITEVAHPQSGRCHSYKSSTEFVGHFVGLSLVIPCHPVSGLGLDRLLLGGSRVFPGVPGWPLWPRYRLLQQSDANFAHDRLHRPGGEPWNPSCSPGFGKGVSINPWEPKMVGKGRSRLEMDDN